MARKRKSSLRAPKAKSLRFVIGAAAGDSKSETSAPSSHDVAEHQGRVPQPGVPAGSRNRGTVTPSGTIVPYTPSDTSNAASPVRSKRQEARKAAKAEAKQEQLVSRFVERTYEKKASSSSSQVGTSLFTVGKRVEEAKKEIRNERERLLSHPAIQEANAEGKVVSPKGLQKIKRQEEQANAFGLPSGLKYSKEHGVQAAGLVLTPAQRRKLELSIGTPQGTVGRTQALARQKRHERGEPSTLEALSIASIGIPGIGIGGSLAKLATVGARAIPEVASQEGLSLLAQKGATSAATRIAASKAAVREFPSVLKASPQLAKTGLRAAPKAAKEALRSSPKTLPKAIGRGALRSGKSTYHLSSGLGALAATQNAGIETKPGQVADAILKGTSAAVIKHPLETAETTARAIPAAVTAPAALLYGAGQVPFEGTGPLEQTAKMQYEGLKQLGGNVLSGNPKRVQKAVQGEGALAFLTPIPALSKTRAYKAIRSDVREAAAGVRRVTGKGRQAPKGVEQGVFGFSDRKAARGRVAKTHTRTTNSYEISKARHKKAILHGTARRPALEKVPPEWGDTISTLLEAGIRGPEGVRLMRERGPKTEPSATGKVNLDRALRIAEENPQMFQSKPFQRALRAAEKASRSNPAALAGMGEVARYRTQGQIFDVIPPDQAVPFAARKLTKAKDREGAWKDVKRLEKTDKAKAKALKKALDPFTRPGQKTAAGKRKFWDNKLEAEFIGKVKAKQEKSPLVEPAWTHHAAFQTTKAGMEPGALPGKAGGKVYVNRGRLAESDLVDRSLSAFIRGTVEMPRARQAGIDFAQEFVRQEKHPFTLGGKKQEIVPDSETWARITSPKSKENPDGGQFDPETYARFPIREWKAAAEDPFTTQGDLAALVSEAEAGRIASHEPSIIVPREAVREFKAIVNPEHGPVTQKLNALSRTSSRLILGTNPSWVLAQTVAEGIPLALAKPSLLNPVKTSNILKEMKRFREEHPEQAAIIEGAAGASPEITAGSLRSPLDLEKQGAFNPQPAMFAAAAKELTRSKWGRAMRSTAKLEPLGLFDIKRQNAYRSVLLAAEADKRFLSWTNGVRGMFRTSAKLSERFKGKTRQELYEWLSTTKQGKKELQKLADYVDDVQGNWTAFSRYEKAFAPFVIFYPFLRYSLRWTLHTFPKTHPLAATLAYTLGQVNSNELEKVLGAKPSSPLGYTWPVVADAEGSKSVLPGGSRVAPGLGTPQQAVLGGNLSQLAGALNPILGAGLTAIGGPGPFGDKPTNPAGWAALDQLLALPAPLRLADIKSEKVASMLGITDYQPESVIAKAFKKLDPNKKLRQGILPSAKQSGKEARMTNELSRALDAASANSKAKREDVAGDDSLTVPERQKRIKTMERKGDQAKATIDRILKKLGLDKEDEAAYERYKAALYGGGEETSIYDAPKKDEGTIYDKSSGTTSIYGDENNPALKYRPPGAPGVDLPNISGPLGALGGILGSLVGGEKARAAQPKRKNLKLTGPLSAGEKTFAKTVARETGLKPETVAAWTLQEGGNSTGDYNRLNVGHTDSGPLGLTADPRWKDPVQAGKLTAEFLKGNYGGASAGIQAILPAAKGKPASQQLDIIANSGWASDPNYASNLQGTLAMVGVKRGKPVPKKTLSRFRAGVVAANELEKAALPYVWGGGHADLASRPTGGGLDCSGAVSYVLNKMGALKGSLTSGEMGSVLKPGPGAVTVFYNPDHTFMRIGKKYFGTSASNPSGGAGYIPASIAGPEAASGAYNVGHVPGLGRKVAVALGFPTGSSGAHATSTFPGMTLSSNGTVATINPGKATTKKKSGFSDKPIKLSPTQKLEQVERITEGRFPGSGALRGSVGPSAAQLAEIGATLSAERRRLGVG